MDRQSHDEACRPGPCIHFDFSAVTISDNSLADSQAKPFARANALGCEKWFEDAREVFRCDTRSVVNYLDNGLVVFTPRADGDLATAADRIDRIVKEV